MTTLLTIGPPHTLVQNEVYALPARKVRLFSQTGAATFLQSNEVAFTTSVAVTLTDGMADLAGGFLKCTSGAVVITLKA